MTNGEKLKEVFPSIELYEKSHDGIQIDFNSVWWNAEYKEPSSSEKPNKSEIPTGSDDCISRADALALFCDKCSVYNCISKCSSYRAVKKMPSVTPIRPKGHWIEHPHELGDNWQYSQYECSCCHNWAHFDTDYCPNCGAEMEEVEE